MPRTRLVNGVREPLSAADEAVRDAQESAWAAAAPARLAVHLEREATSLIENELAPHAQRELLWSALAVSDAKWTGATLTPRQLAIEASATAWRTWIEAVRDEAAAAASEQRAPDWPASPRGG